MRAALLATLGCLSLSEARVLLDQRQATSWVVGQTVQTSSGPVQGHAAQNVTQVSEYLGIPFAQPPIGDLRWAAPQKYTGTSTINGTSFGYACPIGNTVSSIIKSPATFENANLTAAGAWILSNLAEAGEKFSEDCLTLNVWTKPQTGDAKKAVLVWIYGGSFTSGSATPPEYSGKYFADQEDVVLVSFNYRVDIMGFPGSPDTTYIAGLLDQRMAIEWVRDNIAAFGGDPSRITIFGQSAGAESVDYYSFAYADDPIASSFIQESGTVFLLPQYTQAQALAAWYNSSMQLGCGNASTSDTATNLACMRSRNFTSIMKTLPELSIANADGFGPTIDEQVVFSDYMDRAQAGKFSQRPLLIGNNNNEAGLFEAMVAFSGKQAEYLGTWDAYNAVNFVCPAGARANISIAQGVPTWRYRYFGDFPDTQLTSRPASGAYHTSELPVLFGTQAEPSKSIAAITPAEAAIGSYMRGAWAAFARNPHWGLSVYAGGNGTGWPIYNPNGDSLIRLAFNNQTGPNLAQGDSFDVGCDVSSGFNYPFDLSSAEIAGVAAIAANVSAAAASASAVSTSPASATSSSSSSTSLPLSGGVRLGRGSGMTSTVVMVMLVGAATYLL